MLQLECEETVFQPVVPYYFYKIVCRDSSINKVYVGKTKDFKSRMMNHKFKSVISDIKLYQTIREHGGWENWEMVLYHKCICDEQSSTYIEVSIIKQFQDKGFQILNCQIPVDYPNQEYNKKKCREHYAIKKQCACGWFGSKMDWSHHMKSKRHRNFCINKYEQEIAGNNGCHESQI